MKVVTLVGTRPELIKLSEVIKRLDIATDHVFVHTGQNYDYELNEVFYEDLELRKPDHYLNVVGRSLGDTVGNVMRKFEEVLDMEKPDAVVILGDTNSALGGIIAKRKKIPLFHLEAGNRCFDDNVPEEINRRILDHISDVNMVYTNNQRNYLAAEGIAKERTFIMGSPMAEVLAKHEDKVAKSKIVKKLDLVSDRYFLMSIHRDENLEIVDNYLELINTINEITEKYEMPIVLSTHPRLQKKLKTSGVKLPDSVMICKPFGLIDYLKLQKEAFCVLSDSGTISEESALLGFPAITIRNAIERPEAIDMGSILMTGVDTNNIMDCIKYVTENWEGCYVPQDYDVENCSERVVKLILGYTPYINRYVWHK